ncbi:protein NEOXANTHIN-DEFICIENT 1 isoform X3 [Pistacia vera]|uniref:protein NEOXANTHIN-DEFICIENT 1 isoform X3 n=1 Tax=Pistacia vera TaxID=55513 RepID=UPI001263B8C1|nr:protein NEOXANTHIN-DEFICIENT 1 isoform X3 [Pistacia vera]
MEVGETKCSSGYGNPPWTFKGSALYQLHLVKAETARAVIPKELRLVEAFGYTLGGFFLASYEDSPAGAFDELVVIAGIVWNPPTSCAWAARVLVNSDEACDHGRKVEYVGLPSQVARFTKRITAVQGQPKRKSSSFLNMIGLGTTTTCTPKGFMDLQVSENKGCVATDICNIKLATIGPTPKFDQRMGLAIKMSLPSFRVRAVEPAKVSGPSFAPKEDTGNLHQTANSATEELIDNERNLSISVLLSKPIIALEFNCLKMQVEAPIVVANCSKSSLKIS